MQSDNVTRYGSGMFGDSGSGAVFSADMLHRYHLWRDSSGLHGVPYVLWVMLNPSTADERILDPTVRRCVDFTGLWGFLRTEVCNAFALRSTDPKALLSASDPIGPDNMEYIINAAKGATIVVCAWGRDGKMRGQGARVAGELRGLGIPLHCLGRNKDGSPVHPLYIPGNKKLAEF